MYSCDLELCGPDHLAMNATALGNLIVVLMLCMESKSSSVHVQVQRPGFSIFHVSHSFEELENSLIMLG